MNETPQANRIHIAFFGRRNTGKSSLVNAVTGQNLAIVSDIKGTTTDPVYKSMEMLPLGPVVIIDTPGFDDEGELGEMRVNRAKRVLNKTDLAVLVLEANTPSLSETESRFIDILKAKNIPYIAVFNKGDLHSTEEKSEILTVSAKTGLNIDKLKNRITELAFLKDSDKKLVSDLINKNDFVILVIPIDKAAPKGRLILPQQQVIRDILEAGAAVIAVRETELQKTLSCIGVKPALVITDSQVFKEVSAIVPQEIALTSFSILFARYKGFLETSVKGASCLDTLNEGDKILICEGCTHHRQCDDIGTVKIPRLIKAHCSKEIQYSFCSAGDFPQDLSAYKLIIHCGSCMLNEREMQYRRDLAGEQNIPFTNYGITLAHLSGILKRSIAVFST